MLNYPVFLKILHACNALNQPIAEVIFAISVKHGQATNHNLITLIGKTKADNLTKEYLEKGYIVSTLINPDSQLRQYVINRPNQAAVAYFDSIESQIDSFFAAKK